MNTAEFETKLNEVYEGAVKPLNPYLNEHATLCFKCKKCGLVFYNRASHMIGRESQRHVCDMPYGDYKGVRFSQVSGGRNSSTAKKKHKKPSRDIGKLFDNMIKEGRSYQEVASELKVNPAMIKDFFISEGLL